LRESQWRFWREKSKFTLNLTLLLSLSQEVISSFYRDPTLLSTLLVTDSVLRVEEVDGKNFKEVDGI